MDINKLFGNLLPFWDDLEQAEKAALSKDAQLMEYSKKALLHRSQEGCRGIMLVLSGQLRIYIVSEEGREVTLFRVKKGETCVLSASCLMDSIVFDVLIEAAEASKVITIPSPVLAPILKAHPKAEVYLYKTAAERFSDVMWIMQQILFMGADKRVAVFLWDEIAQSGQSAILLTHDEIARYIGSAREVVTKVLKYFAQEGVVSLGRGKIEILDKNRLQKYL